ncbi:MULTISPECIES: DUF2789 family protein [Rheinheimera]|jgi:hypothetical protein|uniref:DUF2789 family protein n=1 Tax=Rheinheimera tilapiae TaxID=875043 RepID=A0ABV6B9G8_9GAMM
MDTSKHNLYTLFDQLGLPSDDASIERFARHYRLTDGQNLYQAEFWTPAQASFLRDAFHQDAEWSDALDQLNGLMR